MRPGEGEGSKEELRLSVAVLPLRLRIDQAVVDFCQVPQQPLHHLGASLWEILQSLVSVLASLALPMWLCCALLLSL